jgi:hypothetical protein
MKHNNIWNKKISCDEYQEAWNKIYFTKQEFFQSFENKSKYVRISLLDFSHLLSSCNEDTDIGFIFTNNFKDLSKGYFDTYRGIKIYVDKSVDFGDIQFSDNEDDFIRSNK